VPSKKNKIYQKGEVIEALPGPTFRVKLENGQETLAHLAGRLRMYYIKVLPGDKVVVEFNQGDFSRGRIVRRE